MVSTRVVNGPGHLIWEKIQTENALQGKYLAQQKFFYEQAKEIEAQKSNKMINRLEVGREVKAREEYYLAQTKLAEVSIVNTEAETAMVITSNELAGVQIHFYTVATVIGCSGAVLAGVALVCLILMSGYETFEEVCRLRDA